MVDNLAPATIDRARMAAIGKLPQAGRGRLQVSLIFDSVVFIGRGAVGDDRLAWTPLTVRFGPTGDA
jgi:hypothetical protein